MPQVGNIRLAVWCAGEPGPITLKSKQHLDSGSAAHRCALRRVRRTQQGSGQSRSAPVLAPAPGAIGAALGLVAARSPDLFRQIDERAADLRILDVRIGADQTDGAGGL